MKQRAQILFLILLPLKFLIAQSDSLKSVEYVLSNFINSATIEKETSDLYDLIEYYLENPIDLNSASKSDLMKLPFANIEEVNLIVKYRKSNGEIFSYGELKVVDYSFGNRHIRKLLIDGMNQGGIDMTNGLSLYEYSYYIQSHSYQCSR